MYHCTTKQFVEGIDVANHLYELRETYGGEKDCKTYIATESIGLFKEVNSYFNDGILVAINKPTEREYQDLLVKLNNGEIVVASEATEARKLIQIATQDKKSFEYLVLLNAYKVAHRYSAISPPKSIRHSNTRATIARYLHKLKNRPHPFV